MTVKVDTIRVERPRLEIIIHTPVVTTMTVTKIDEPLVIRMPENDVPDEASIYTSALIRAPRAPDTIEEDYTENRSPIPPQILRMWLGFWFWRRVHGIEDTGQYI